MLAATIKIAGTIAANWRTIAKGGATSVGVTAGNSLGGSVLDNQAIDPLSHAKALAQSGDTARADAESKRAMMGVGGAILGGIAATIITGAVLATIGAPALAIIAGTYIVGTAGAALVGTLAGGGTLKSGLKATLDAIQDPIVGPFVSGLLNKNLEKPHFNPLGIPALITEIKRARSPEPSSSAQEVAPSLSTSGETQTAYKSYSSGSDAPKHEPNTYSETKISVREPVNTPSVQADRTATSMRMPMRAGSAAPG